MEATGNEVQFFVCMCVCVCVWSGLSHSHEVRATPYALTLRLVLRL